MKRNHVYLSGLLATALFFSACDKNDDVNEDVNPQDQSFVTSASRSNRAEVALGGIALEKGTNASVKMHAQMMITEHTAAQNELQDIADDLDVESRMTDSLDAEQIAMRTMLLSMPAGATFDSAYIDGQISGHVKTLAAVDAEIASGQNVQLKNFATTKRPSIQMHKDMADSIFVLVR